MSIRDYTDASSTSPCKKRRGDSQASLGVMVYSDRYRPDPGDRYRPRGGSRNVIDRYTPRTRQGCRSSWPLIALEH